MNLPDFKKGLLKLKFDLDSNLSEFKDYKLKDGRTIRVFGALGKDAKVNVIEEDGSISVLTEGDHTLVLEDNKIQTITIGAEGITAVADPVDAPADGTGEPDASADNADANADANAAVVDVQMNSQAPNGNGNGNMNQAPTNQANGQVSLEMLQNQFNELSAKVNDIMAKIGMTAGDGSNNLNAMQSKLSSMEVQFTDMTDRYNKMLEANGKMFDMLLKFASKTPTGEPSFIGDSIKLDFEKDEAQVSREDIESFRKYF